MSQATEDDIQALAAELKNLRADFAKIAELLKDTARHGSADAADKIRETAERGWSGAKDTAHTLIGEMEERPVHAALFLFGAGVLIGLLVGGGRR
jgi:hypothetical protein